MRIIWLMLSLFLLAGASRAQEINFSRVQDMAIWYNQSLKTDKQNSLKLNYRNIQYGGAIAYNSTAAMFDMPLLSKAAKEKGNTGYFSFSVGGASDKSNQGILNNTLGLLGLSYAVPIGRNETYLSLGFQGSYYQSTLNTNGVLNAFGDQFDSYGPVEGTPSSDRLASGWSYGHFNINTGISVFKNAERDKWYFGASMLQVNQPYTDKIKTAEFKLKPGMSFQGGYKSITANEDEVAFYMTLNWQGSAYKHFFNASYIKNLPSIPGAGVGFGLGYRVNDAVVPDVELRYQKLIFALLYDVNVSGINAAGGKRNGLELAVRMDF